MNAQVYHEPGTQLPPRVLVADDSSTIRKYVIRVLQDCLPGAVFDQAEDGAEALDMVASHSYKMLVLDVMMPGVDGLEFLDKALDRWIRPTTGVMVLSAVVHSEAIAVYEKHPNVRFLRKPADPADIKRAVGDFLRLKISL